MADCDGATAPCWNHKIGQLIEHNPNCGLRDNQRNNGRVAYKADQDHDFRFELFLLDEGQKKVEWKEETRKPTQNTPLDTDCH